MNGNRCQTIRTKSQSILIGLLLIATSPVWAQETKVSSFGEYSGYSEEIYNGYLRTSEYIITRDGTKLAADIFRPTLNGEVVNEPLPVIWAHERYQRAYVTTDKETGETYVAHKLAKEPWLETLVKHGYIVAVVDSRGSGASYGTRHGPFNVTESLDAYDMTEWFASQAWCNGRIGMFGSSYLGISQYMAASAMPPHLVAIFPDVALTDLYQFAYAGGVYKNDFMSAWGGLCELLDKNGRPVAPVDADTDGSMLAEALAEHETNDWVQYFFPELPYRDSWDPGANGVLWSLNSPISYLSNIEELGVAIYHWAGWFDGWPRDQLVMFSNLKNPQRIAIGPWPHKGGRESPLYLIEHLRWYDYWLKDIDNGVMQENSLFYGTLDAHGEELWQSSDKWPIKDASNINYYFLAGPSGSVNSVNDGILGQKHPKGDGIDSYNVDYSTTSGTVTRWTNIYTGGFGYPDMTPNDEKGLTYTSEPLSEIIQITGHPVVHLWVTSTATDGDFFAYLEEVNANGVSSYVTEGTLRASHRSLAKPDYDYLKLPYHRSYAEDLADLPAGPVELVFDLHPTSNFFEVGHRIRLTVVCADADSYETPVLDPAPTINVYRSKHKASYVTLPIVVQAYNPGLCSCRVFRRCEAEGRRRTLVFQVPDRKADSVKSATPCGFKCRKNILKSASPSE